MVTLKKIFLVFLKIGTFSFGGVYSMVAFFERELVSKRKWITHDEFVESLAIGQMAPGPPIINTGIAIGYKLHKLRGALAATVGQAFTGTVLAILLAAFYLHMKDNPLLQSVMKGVAAAVVGLLASFIYKMFIKLVTDYRSATLVMAAFLSLAIFKVNPIGILLAAGALGLVLYRRD
ncbi:MAG: chromate transporter [Desulfobaccales bacterium]|jgi:chromate transporter